MHPEGITARCGESWIGGRDLIRDQREFYSIRDRPAPVGTFLPSCGLNAPMRMGLKIPPAMEATRLKKAGIPLRYPGRSTLRRLVQGAPVLPPALPDAPPMVPPDLPLVLELDPVPDPELPELDPVPLPMLPALPPVPDVPLEPMLPDPLPIPPELLPVPDPPAVPLLPVPMPLVVL